MFNKARGKGCSCTLVMLLFDFPVGEVTSAGLTVVELSLLLLLSTFFIFDFASFEPDF